MQVPSLKVIKKPRKKYNRLHLVTKFGGQKSLVGAVHRPKELDNG